MLEIGTAHTRRALLGASLCALAACSTDTSGLERREPTGDAHAGASSAPAPVAGSAGEGGGAPIQEGEGSAGPDAGAPGALTVVHGLVDGGNLFVCLRDRAGGATVGVTAAQPASGLPYGEGLELPVTWDPSRADVELQLFAASPSLWSGSSCAELAEAADARDTAVPDAAAADAGAAPFPLEPAVPRRAGSARFAPGVLRAGARMALIAAGCTGPGASDHEDACGQGEGPFREYQGLVLAEVSASAAVPRQVVALQFVNASRAVARAGLALQGEGQAPSSPLGNDVGFGVVRPLRPALVEEPIGLELHLAREQASSYTQAWSDTLPAGTGGAEARAGRSFLLAYVGPAPSTRITGLARSRFVLIAGD